MAGVEAAGGAGLGDGVGGPVHRGGSRGVRCGSVFHVIWNQERNAAGLDQIRDEDTDAAVRAGVEAIRLLIQQHRRRADLGPVGQDIGGEDIPQDGPGLLPGGVIRDGVLCDEAPQPKAEKGCDGPAPGSGG